MKRLYLIRHAKSSWKHQDLDDFDRPLNNRGKRDAPNMGKRLKEQNAAPDLLLSSPANRALTTAETIAGEIGYPIENIEADEDIYLAGVTTLLTVIKNITNDHHTVFLFGHNPGFTELANALANIRIDNVPTCGIVCIDFEIASWKQVGVGKGTLVSFEYPKQFI